MLPPSGGGWRVFSWWEHLYPIIKFALHGPLVGDTAKLGCHRTIVAHIRLPLIRRTAGGQSSFLRIWMYPSTGLKPIEAVRSTNFERVERSNDRVVFFAYYPNALLLKGVEFISRSSVFHTIWDAGCVLRIFALVPMRGIYLTPLISDNCRKNMWN